MDALLTTFLQFYGLDWVAMALGLTGSYMISNQDKRGFAFSAVACACGLCVAIISGQTGFIAYNAVLIALMLKGYATWGRAKTASA